MKNGGKMAKPGKPGPGPRKPPLKGPQNRQVNAQSRRVLVQHYRAKHGVK